MYTTCQILTKFGIPPTPDNLLCYPRITNFMIFRPVTAELPCRQTYGHYEAKSRFSQMLRMRLKKVLKPLVSHHIFPGNILTHINKVQMSTRLKRLQHKPYTTGKVNLLLHYVHASTCGGEERCIQGFGGET
jgi:hypothetical protein